MNIFDIMDSVEKYGFFIDVTEVAVGRFDVVFSRLDMSAGETVGRNLTRADMEHTVRVLAQAVRVISK